MIKWALSRQNKIAASGVLFALCLLILFSNYIVSNYIDRRHSDHAKKSIRTLYEDRLLAQDYILKMTRDFYQIKEAMNVSESDRDSVNGRNAALISDIRVLCNSYLKTKLTDRETTKFTELLKIVDDFESSLLHSIESERENANKALVLLSELSTIQLDESKRIMDHAEISFLSGKTSFQFSSAVALIILLVLLALVLTCRTLPNPDNHTSARAIN